MGLWGGPPWRVVLSGLFSLTLLRALYGRLPKRRNVKGRCVPTACGVAPLLGWVLSGEGKEGLFALVAAVGGLLDDLRPREAGGVRRRLLRLLEGEFDPALAKALLVLVSAAAAARRGREGQAGKALDALLAASFAHTVNLLDTAPGRAVKWLALWGAVALRALRGRSERESVASILSALATYAPGDLSGLYIMGDSGAYGLGVALGSFLCRAPIRCKLAMIALFLGLSIYAEFGSISRAIERLSVLNFTPNLEHEGEGK